MNRFALLSLYRSLTRHKLYAALNIGGLALGIAVFIVLGLYVRFETNYERWLPSVDRVYVVQTVWDAPGSPSDGAVPFTMGGLLTQMQQDFPGVVGTRIWGGRNAGTVLRGNSAYREDVAKVDSDFFKVFDLPMLWGSKRESLLDPNNAFISETISRRYFGNKNPDGRILTISIFGSTRNYKIAGVFKDFPPNTDLDFTIIIPIENIVQDKTWFLWGSLQLATYLRFEDTKSARSFEEKLPAFVSRRGAPDLGPDAERKQHLKLLPLSARHLEPRGSSAATIRNTVIALALVGMLTLAIAIVNYINLATASSVMRAREIAMRKVLGANRLTLIRQFLGEAILAVTISSLIGLILAELGLPLINAAGGLHLSIRYSSIIPSLLLLIIFVGIVAGIYPAILFSSLPAASVLSSARSPGGGRSATRTREYLVIFQFGLSIAFMIGTTIMLFQMYHVRNSDLGFKRDDLIVVDSIGDALIDAPRRRAILQGMRSVPGVTSVALANTAAGGGGDNSATNVPIPGASGDGPSLSWSIVGPHFFQSYGAHLIAGRFFDDQHAGDDAQLRKDSDDKNIVINSRAVTTLGFKSPEDSIGKTVGRDHPMTIIGVVKDLRFRSLRETNVATYYLYYSNPESLDATVATIRYSGDSKNVIASLKELWQQLSPQVPFSANTVNQAINRFYEDDEHAAQLFTIGSVLAALISCVGLWGLSSFMTARRMKEIGIRKTLGASSGDITRLLVSQFLRPVIFANIISWPVAYFIMRSWLAGFNDKIEISPIFFIMPSLIAIAIAVLTVLGQALRASRAAPAWALRHD